MSYACLRDHFARVGQLEELLAIVEWDQAVNMPPAAGPSRAEAMAGLSRISHDLLSQPQVADWLEAADQDSDHLSQVERANLALMKRAHRRACALPGDLVETATKTCKTSEQAWRRYRAENDFASYAPFLEKVVAVQREVGQALGASLDLSPYDALMDEFEPGLYSADVDRVFAELRPILPQLIREVIEMQRGQSVISPQGPFAIEAQKKLGEAMMAATGLFMDRVRLDVSHHPFCGGVPADVRVTTRYKSDEFVSSLMGVLHESGHAKYEQGLPEEFRHQPVGKARGMVCHESQSLLQEMQVCRSAEFMRFLAPQVQAAFPAQAAQNPQALSAENLYRLVTRVRPGLIRVDADEVTYPAHILLRYDLERDLVSGKLTPRDLPEAWDAGMQAQLGLRTVGNDRDGCMQDIHWPLGAFGYFPLYTLGALVAAQLFGTARAELPNLSDELARGDFTGLNAFLAENVWRHGASKTVSELLEAATGEPLRAHYFLDHLRRRYLGQP